MQNPPFRYRESYYDTESLWKVGHPFLDNNKAGGKTRLNNLVRRITKDPRKLSAYRNIIKEQLSAEINYNYTIGPSEEKSIINNLCTT